MGRTLLDRVVAPEQHRGCGGKQEYGEGEQQRPAADEPVQRSAGDLAGRAGRSERQRSSDLHAADPGVVGGAGQGGGSYDEQRFGRRLFDGLAERVNERGYGEDRAATADQAEQEPDPQAEGQREQRPAHRCAPCLAVSEANVGEQAVEPARQRPGVAAEQTQ